MKSQYFQWIWHGQIKRKFKIPLVTLLTLRYLSTDEKYRDVKILSVNMTEGQQIFLEENKVKNKSWNFVLIKTDMGSIVSPLTQNLASS